MVMALPLAVIRSSATRSLRIGIIALAALSLALLATVAAIVYPFVSAIKRLARAMREATDADFRFDEVALPAGGRSDEIGALRDGFVAMMERIDRLINLEYRYRMENQEARLRALQAQIDPHFINNALQSIGTMALRRGSRDVYGSLLSLSRMIGYATDPSAETRRLGDEIEQVRRYIGIQALRFGERLRASFDVEAGAEGLRVPPLLLQPIVENSIEHGLEESREGISVSVAAKVSGGMLELSVADTGTGMAAAGLEALRDSLLSPEGVVGESSHIGLRNVAERVRLCSGGRGSVEISSAEGKGTTVILTLPVDAAGEGEPCAAP